MESLNSMHGLELKFEFVNATPELRIQVLRHFDSLTPIMQCKGNIGFQSGPILRGAWVPLPR